MLLLNSKNLLGQNDTIPVYNVKDSLVTVPISYIKQANLKLVEGKHYKTVCEQQDKLILNLKELSSVKDEEITKLRVYNYQLEEDIRNYENLNCSLENSLYKSKTRNIIFGSIAVTSTIVAILKFIIK